MKVSVWWSALTAAVEACRRPSPGRAAELDAERRRGRLRLDVERARRALPEQDQTDGGGDSSESARSR